MGICASCLGRQRNDSIDEDDVSRLLFDDPNHMQYGSFADHNLNSQADPLESQREVEALQRIVARTSNNLVDVFEITPQGSQRTHPVMFSEQDARLTRYQNILSNLSSDEATATAESNQGGVEWLLNEEDNAELPEQIITIKEGASGPLVGTFADAVAAVA
ncbi:late endosomal/lysosomal adaptor and MAPK and MTOR activator-domain-containing protein [Ustulina deusta]|nr:late endosomal/lysosomal adaptor and MAPK and MTOR activator-domain-containing protein [Ustulina deusta]KAI3333783.1 late endosomal/lysosomal adaptor and MAPK and MTOR activator-domain-containing protein [Ustulina deusta]